MMNQLKRCQPAASAKERSEPAGTRIEKLAGILDRRRRCETVGYQQMKRSARDEATSCWESADGLVLMTSSVTSSYSADGLRDQSQESAVSHTVDAVVHLWSLGVLTAAGCGIGSVHAVVRSNLLVEPSEVEEGEIVSSLSFFSHTEKCFFKADNSLSSLTCEIEYDYSLRLSTCAPAHTWALTSLHTS
ncbi:hypothetical protein F511_18569 [Dorcoceras hygrometricum]|uniref:Uncharacterized protein n=1 Tax=Dorcoceras hygrometricum TaxID=472368 RepID=A0A2Z7AHW2_9LAMI|nr:hypothetical protein F511_18569 [Dorcoceras hygrometricum]